MRLIAAIFVVALSGATTVCSQDVGGHALFVRTADADPARSRVQRAAASVSPADVMAQNILEWIQGIYQQGTRKTRQQSDANAYLPPFSTQRPPEKPRPFQVATGSQQNEVTGYPAQRPSSLYTPPNVGYSASRQPSSTPFSTPRPNLQPSSTYVPQGFRGSTSYNPRPSQPSYSNTGSSAFPPLNPPESSSTYLPPQPPSVLPTNQSPRPSSTGTGTGIPTLARGLSLGGSTGVSTDIEESGNAPATPPVLLEGGVAYAAPAAGYPASGYPSGGYPTGGGYPSTGEGYFTTTATPRPSFPPPDQRPSVDVGTNVITTGTGPGPIGPTGTVGVTATGTTSVTEDDLSHPPHIHNLDVQCSKTMMTINIEFNRAFDGVIYSKGYFMNPECTYVKQNSGLTQYSFTVSLDSCGTQFINDFEGAAGQAYLEHVLVLQNEPGIQEVWDTVRRVRCLWEGNINKALTVNLSVDMLNQEIVTFSGDTATAKLDIQIGKGPFAPAADGLVKIGETMTLVVSVEGDPGFDLQVRDCLARDEASTNNMLQLTDERGCILKPKLFGAFQKTNDTGNTGASIIAYAFFQAFKFPDVMDLFIECNVELCKTNCEPCPEANQQIEPGRRRRSVTYAPSSNTSTNSILLSDPVRVGRRFKVIMLDDLSTASSQILDSMEETAVEALTKAKEVCMSNSGFYTTFSLMLSTLFIATISATVLYIKLQRIRRPKSVDS